MKKLSLAVLALLIDSTSQIKINSYHKDWEQKEVTAADAYNDTNLDGYQDAVDEVF